MLNDNFWGKRVPIPRIDESQPAIRKSDWESTELGGKYYTASGLQKFIIWGCSDESELSEEILSRTDIP